MLLLKYTDNHDDILKEISDAWPLLNLSMKSEDSKYVTGIKDIGIRTADISNDALNVKLRPSMSQFVTIL
jgi:hypothetical protein